jgi:hypothetical protein
MDQDEKWAEVVIKLGMSADSKDNLCESRPVPRGTGRQCKAVHAIVSDSDFEKVRGIVAPGNVDMSRETAGLICAFGPQLADFVVWAFGGKISIKRVPIASQSPSFRNL